MKYLAKLGLILTVIITSSPRVDAHTRNHRNEEVYSKYPDHIADGIDQPFDLYRYRTPAGWLVVLKRFKSITSAFIPDENHSWDIGESEHLQLWRKQLDEFQDKLNEREADLNRRERELNSKP